MATNDREQYPTRDQERRLRAELRAHPLWREMARQEVLAAYERADRERNRDG